MLFPIVTIWVGTLKTTIIIYYYLLIIAIVKFKGETGLPIISA